ncbi:hypothetical protein SLA2020_076060 [Shorea laevis]
MTLATTSNLTFRWPSPPQCCHGVNSSTTREWVHNCKKPKKQSAGPPTTFSSAPPPLQGSSMSVWATRMLTTSSGSGPRTWTPSDPCIWSHPATLARTSLPRLPQR